MSEEIVKIKLCGTKGEFVDSIVLEDTLENIQKFAKEDWSKRGFDTFWSEEVK